MIRASRTILVFICVLIFAWTVFAKSNTEAKPRRNPTGDQAQPDYKCKIIIEVTYDDGEMKTNEYLDPAKTIDECRRVSKIYLFPKATYVTNQKVTIVWAGVQ